MAAGLSAQINYHLSTASFPVVVLTESALLGESERTRVFEELMRLLDERGRHVLVVDLMLGAALPDAQRKCLAELTQMRGELIKAKWAGLAIVVGEPIQSKASKAASWQQALPASVPTDCFASLEGATQWAESQLRPGRASNSGSPGNQARGTRPPATGTPWRPSGAPERPSAPKRTSRLSGPNDANQVASRTSISAYLSSPPKKALKAGGPPKKTAKPRPKDLKAWLKGPRGIGVGVALLAAAILWLLTPSVDGLSFGEARAFAAAKDRLALRLRRQRVGRAEPLQSGATFARGEKLRFEIDVPARGYILILSVRQDGSAYAAGPSAGLAQAALINAGPGLVIPGSYVIDAPVGQLSLFLVGCPQPFAPKDCSGSATGLDCPDDCGVASFALNATL